MYNYVQLLPESDKMIALYLKESQIDWLKVEKMVTVFKEMKKI